MVIGYRRNRKLGNPDSVIFNVLPHVLSYSLILFFMYFLHFIFVVVLITRNHLKVVNQDILYSERGNN